MTYDPHRISAEMMAEALTNHALASKLRDIADRPRKLQRVEQQAVLREAATRLERIQ
jgi:hypothetical protein